MAIGIDELDDDWTMNDPEPDPNDGNGGTEPPAEPEPEPDHSDGNGDDGGQEGGQEGGNGEEITNAIYAFLKTKGIEDPSKIKFEDDDTLDRVYLKEIAEEMDLPIPKTSEIVKALQAKGMVNWTFDGKGEDGTYVTITEKGENFLKDNKVYFEEFSEKIIERFGKERFEQFIGMMAEIEQITLEMRAEGV